MPSDCAPLFSIQRIGCDDAKVADKDGDLVVHDAIRGTHATFGRVTQTRTVGPFTMHLIETVIGTDGVTVDDVTVVVETCAESPEVTILVYGELMRGSKRAGHAGHAAATLYLAQATEADLKRDFIRGSCHFGGHSGVAVTPPS